MEGVVARTVNRGVISHKLQGNLPNNAAWHPDELPEEPGTVKELNSECRAERAAQKERAREKQKERRELMLDDRRTQTAALVTALNAMAKVMERLEAKSAKE